MNTFTTELETAVAIAREAGVIMLKYFEEGQELQYKADNTHVTIADKLINSLVIERLSKIFPEDGIIGEEESTSDYGMGRKCICAPIDRTAAYSKSIPTAMFSLALVIDGKPVVGVAFDPFLNKMYTAITGEKSMCNGKELNVSNEDLTTGTVAVTGGIKVLPKREHFLRMVEDKVRVTTFSGSVYKCCLVSRGKLAGYVENGVSNHDVAATFLIVHGAGGKMTALDGTELDFSKPFKGVIASNGVVHQKIVEYCR